MCDYSATYSPDDNKLRLYASTRLDGETYQRMKAAGFRWAPKQDLFVAPMWTPSREDLLIELCGQIDDEDTSLADRAEQRAERFEDYTEKRQRDAKQASDGVQALADHIPLGQPILVGHHSERGARRDARRIENGMRKAVKCWKTADYWTRRAASALQHAKYKERADVRARRIRRLEADLRKVERNRDEAAKQLGAWRTNGLTYDQALHVANFDHVSASFALAQYPRVLPASQYEGSMSLWSALNGKVITTEQAKAMAVESHVSTMAWGERWIAHYENRLAYERAMLDETGYVEPPKKVGKAALPLLNYPGTVETRNRWREGTTTYTARPITRAAFAQIPNDYKGTLVSADGTHRVRITMGAWLQLDTKDDNTRHAYYVVVLTDSKQNPRPVQDATTDARIATGQAAIQTAEAERGKVRAHNRAVLRENAGQSITRLASASTEKVDAMREQLRAGVHVEVAPLLYPSPRALAERMVLLAELQPGMTLLEPSAGTGALLHAARTSRLGVITTAIEIDYRLAHRLRLDFDDVRHADFLQCDPLGPFDRVLMNPPFNQGADMAHIEHAHGMLNPGGVLVAICANGPRQNARLRPRIEAAGGRWEALPAGTFAQAGTNVQTVLLVWPAM